MPPTGRATGAWSSTTELAPAAGRDLWVLPVTPEGKPAPDAKPRALPADAVQRIGRAVSRPNHPALGGLPVGRIRPVRGLHPGLSGAARQVQISTGGGQYPQWGAGGRELFYVSPDNKLMAVSLKLGADSVEPSAPRELFPLPAVDIGWSPYDATPDGQRFLVRATPAQAGQPLTVIVNWPALLKKGAAAQ